MPSQPNRQSLRLNKYLAENLGVSRREADNMIVDGRVIVDDSRAVLGARIFPESRIEVDGKRIDFSNNHVYIAMNKPVGYVCSKKRQGDTPTVYELLPEKYQLLKSVGRLDKDSSGLILFTNDGDFAYMMTHPKFAKTKVYQVELDHDLMPLHQQMISDFGVQLPDGVSKLGLTRLNSEKADARRRFEVEMHEGRNRQIRRTFAALGYDVKKLHRISFGKYKLDGLKTGSIAEIIP